MISHLRPRWSRYLLVSRLSLVLGTALGWGLVLVVLLQSAKTGAVQTTVFDLVHPSGGHYPNCRFGVGGAISSTYPITSLNLGWYMDWGTQLNPDQVAGMEYMQVVRVKPAVGSLYTFTPPLERLYQIADQNPGAVWLIGNEPDSPWQDKLRPELYAQAYHDLYHWLKQHDRFARIGVGSIVQPTPIRLEYLDRMLRAYWQMYGEALPADLWSIHSYILREIDPSDPEADPQGPYAVWGAYLPPGFLPQITRGELYTFVDTLSVTIFRQRLIDFRIWMRNRGYREKSLFITEYGALFPYPPFINFTYFDELERPLTEERAAAFMTQTFDILQTITDPSIGYLADGNRLVQRWLWYSFDDATYGGLLFNPFSGQRTLLGDEFMSYTQAISPTIDLLAVHAQGEVTMVPAGYASVTSTLLARFSNAGNISTTTALTVTFFEGALGQSEHPIGLPQIMTQSLQGCASSSVITTAWSNRPVGTHLFHVRIETNAPESALANNQIEGWLLVADHQVWLPLIRHDG